MGVAVKSLDGLLWGDALLETGQQLFVRLKFHLRGWSSEHAFKLVLLGSQMVGKSSLVVRLVTGHFIEHCDPTIEDSYRKSMQVDGKPVLLDILDTAGEEEFASLQDQWIREGEGYMILCSLENENAFQE